jgi:hypothetical protein
VKPFSITLSEGPVIPGVSGQQPGRNAATKILQTGHDLSDEGIERIFDEWDAMVNCVRERIASCVGSKYYN